MWGSWTWIIKQRDCWAKSTNWSYHTTTGLLRLMGWADQICWCSHSAAVQCRGRLVRPDQGNSCPPVRAVIVLVLCSAVFAKEAKCCILPEEGIARSCAECSAFLLVDSEAERVFVDQDQPAWGWWPPPSWNAERESTRVRVNIYACVSEYPRHLCFCSASPRGILWDIDWHSFLNLNSMFGSECT